MKKKWLFIMLVVLVVSIVGGLYFFFSQKNEKSLENYIGIEIDIKNSSPIITKNNLYFYQQETKTIFNEKGILLKKLKKNENYIIIEDNIYLIQEKENRYGVTDINNKVIIPYQYNKIWKYQNVLKVIKEGKTALIDLEGKELTPFVNLYQNLIVSEQEAPYYESIQFMNLKNNLTIFIEDDKLNLLDENFQKIRLDFDIFPYLTKTPFAYSLNQKENDFEFFQNQKFINLDLSKIEEIELEKQKFYFLPKDSGWGIMDENLREIIPFKYQAISYIEEYNAFWAITDRENILYHIDLYDLNGTILNSGELKEFDKLSHPISTKGCSGPCQSFVTISKDLKIEERNFVDTDNNTYLVNFTANSYIKNSENLQYLYDIKTNKKLAQGNILEYITNRLEEYRFIKIKNNTKRKYGLLNELGEVLLPIEYDEIKKINNNFIYSRQDNHLTIWSIKKEKLEKRKEFSNIIHLNPADFIIYRTENEKNILEKYNDNLELIYQLESDSNQIFSIDSNHILYPKNNYMLYDIKKKKNIAIFKTNQEFQKYHGMFQNKYLFESNDNKYYLYEKENL